MKRLLFFCLLAVTAWLEFKYYPGHSYLLGDTQVLVPALEHLDKPGLLSRDLVATHPALTYTLYDEITLFIHRSAGWTLQRSLQAQQLAFRFCALLGVFLLARQADVSRWASLALAAVVMCGGRAFGPGIPLIDRDPQPATFAVCAVLLAAGLFASSYPILAGLFGGIALIYDLRMAAALWIIAIVATVADPSARRMFRASLPILAVFALLVANASQLQPAIPEARDFLERLPPAIAHILRFRTPRVWVSEWPPLAVVWQGVLLVWAMVAARFLWPSLTGPARWVLIGMPVAGVAGMLGSAVLLDGFGWALIPEWQPSHLLIFTALIAAALSGMAFVHLLKARKRYAALFVVLPLALPLTNRPVPRRGDSSKLSAWAVENTWGGSMFLFPDAGRDLYPGSFRAQSQRAVWVDWETGRLSDHFDSFADEWFRRWEDTMPTSYDQRRLQQYVSLPIDYVVLRRDHPVPDAKPVYSDDQFVVYDAHDLRRAG